MNKTFEKFEIKHLSKISGGVDECGKKTADLTHGCTNDNDCITGSGTDSSTGGASDRALVVYPGNIMVELVPNPGIVISKDWSNTKKRF